MSAFFEGRSSDSPHVEYIWRGHVEEDYDPVCPADVRWNLLFMKYQEKVRVSVEGATTQFVPKHQFKGAEFLVIKFKLGVFMPYLSPANVVNGDAILPGASQSAFWLNGFAWDMPDFDNVENFVDRLVREDILVTQSLVTETLSEKSPDVSSRTVRRHFQQATGLTPKTIEQIERANRANLLLQQGTPILDTVYELGYSDQPHMTRSLKRFVGFTPGEILAQAESA